MPTLVPLGGVECAMRVPLGDVEWHAHIQRRSEVIGEGTALGGGTVDMDS